MVCARLVPDACQDGQTCLKTVVRPVIPRARLVVMTVTQRRASSVRPLRLGDTRPDRCTLGASASNSAPAPWGWRPARQCRPACPLGGAFIPLERVCATLDAHTCCEHMRGRCSSGDGRLGRWHDDGRHDVELDMIVRAKPRHCPIALPLRAACVFGACCARGRCNCA